MGGLERDYGTKGGSREDQAQGELHVFRCWVGNINCSDTTPRFSSSYPRLRNLEAIPRIPLSRVQRQSPFYPNEFANAISFYMC
jgi:hypothetical protein